MNTIEETVITEEISENIEEDVARLREKGYQFLADAPTPGAHGSKVIFIHPKRYSIILFTFHNHT